MPTSNPIDKYYWVGSIETASGKSVDLVNFTPDMVDLEDIAQSLSLICRYNGHLPGFYSVAEHSVRVSWWLRQNQRSIQEQLSGLLHDAAEAYVGDMVRPIKRMEGIGNLHQQMESNISKVIHETLGGVYPHSDYVHQADRELYNWEVENIRSGIRRGWPPSSARESFLIRYRLLKEKLDDRSI